MLRLLTAWNRKLKMKSCEQEVCRYQQTDLWTPLYLDGHRMLMIFTIGSQINIFEIEEKKAEN